MREMRVDTGSLMQLKAVLNLEETVSLALADRLAAASRSADPAEARRYDALIRTADRLSEFFHIMAHASEVISGETEHLSKKARAELEENIHSMRRKTLF